MAKRESLALAQHEFAPVLGAKPMHGLELPDGQHLVRYLGDTSAVVEQEDTGRTSLLESNYPLRTRTHDGSLEPIDLHLEDTKDSFTTVNAPVEVRVGKDLAEGVELNGAVTLRPVQPASSAIPQLVSGKPFFAGSAADTDLWVTPQAGGAEIFTQIRSPEAPEVEAYDVDMPAGAALRLAAGDSGAAEIADDKGVIATISPPIAHDADGQPVPIRYSIQGDRLLVHVEHRGGDFRYPILADPEVTVDRWWVYGNDQGQWTPNRNPSTGGGAWTFAFDYGSGTRASWGRGLWIYDQAGGAYDTYWSGEWMLPWNHGTSYITQLQYGGADFDPRVQSGQSKSCQTFGIWSPATGSWEGNTTYACTQHVGLGGTVTASPGTAGNHATMMLWSTAPAYGATQSVSQVDWMRVWLSDGDNPTISSVSHSVPTTTWGDTGTRTVTITASDAGLGLKRIDVRVPSTGSSTPWTDSCVGNYDGGQCTNAAVPHDISYSLDALPQGDGTVTGSAQAFDPIDHGSSLWTWGLKIDHTNPVIDSKTGTASNANGWLTEGSKDLRVQSHDDYSGVQTSTVSIGPSLVGRDTFSRTTANGWGTATSGQAWTPWGGAASSLFSTNGSQGLVSLPQSSAPAMQLGSESMRDANVKVQVNLPTAQQSTGEVLGSIVTRATASNFYGSQLVRDATGKILLRLSNLSSVTVGADVDTGLRYSSGDQYWLRTQVSGVSPTNIKTKAWKVGTPEPSTWAFDRNDSTTGPQQTGALLLMGKQTATPGAQVLGFDNYTVSDLAMRDVSTQSNRKPDNSVCDAASGCAHPMDHSFNWDTTEEVEGAHSVKVHVNDPLGHAPADQTWTTYVDNQAPVATAGPAGTLWSARGQWIRKGTYDLSATVTDPGSGSGIHDVRVYVDGVEQDTANATQTCSQTCPPSMSRSYVFDTTARINGPHGVQVIAHDNAGHSLTLADFTVKVDNNNPSQGSFTGDLQPPVPATAKKWVGPGTHTLTHTPTDAGSGVMRDYSGVSRRIVTDTFSRNTIAGWGAADRGGLYSVGHTGGASFSTNGSEGVMNVPYVTQESQVLAGINARDLDAQVSMRFPSLTLEPAGWLAAGVATRRTGCTGSVDGCQTIVYLVVAGDGRVLLQANNTSAAGEVNVVPQTATGLTYAPGDTYKLRFRMLGSGPTTMQAKLWKAGTAEPAAWTLEKTGLQFSNPVSEAPGSVGLRVISAFHGTNDVRFDDFTVDEFAPQTSYQPTCDRSSVCPPSAPAQSLNWDTTGQDQGAHQVLAYTSDAVEQTALQDWKVYLDTQAPAISGTPTGTLWDNNGKFIPAGTYDLHTTATDTGGSGVKNVQVLVNGTQEDSANASQACGDDCPSPATRNFTFDTTGRPDGTYRVQVIARDKVDNATTLADVSVKLDGSAPTQTPYGGSLFNAFSAKWVGPGTYNLTHVPADSGSGVMRDWAVVGDTVGSDTFGRSVASGWGTADKGGAWQLAYTSGGSNSTDGSAGSMFLGTGQLQTMQLGNVAPRDVDMRVRMKFPNSGGNSVAAGLIARRHTCASGPSDQCHVRVLAILINGTVFLRGVSSTGVLLWPDVNTGLVWSATDRYWVRARLMGANPTTIQAKLWKDGASEPATWAVTKTGRQLLAPVEQVAGGVGVRATTQVPAGTEVRFDQFQVEDLTPQSTYAPSCDAASGCPTSPGQQTLTWNTAGKDDGRHQVEVVTTDAVDHATVTSGDVYLDATRPTTSNYSGSLSNRGTTIAPGHEMLSVDAADASSGVQSVDLLVNGTQQSHVGGDCTSTQCGTTKHADLTWDSAGSSGQQTITVRVTDLAGNPFEDSWQVNVDGTPPTLTLSGRLAPPLATGRDLHMEADDADGGIAKFEVWLDPATHPDPVRYTPENCVPWCGHHESDDFALDPNTTPGLHTLRVRVTDAAGLPAEKEWQITVVDLLPASRSKLGLEHWFQYDDVDSGGGSKVFVNAETGNAVWHSVPIVNPGQGLSTVVNLTYNSQDRGGILGSELGRIPLVDMRSQGFAQDLPGISYGQAGVGFSIGVSGPTRLNEPLGGVILAQATEEHLPLPTDVGNLNPSDGTEITLTDSDGTVHTFTSSDGKWLSPPGLNMNLRRYKPGGTVANPIPDKWAMTRPDGVTHFFDNLGYQTSTQDRNGNKLRYCYEVYNAVTGIAPAHGSNNDCDHPPAVPECAGVDLGAKTLVNSVPVVCEKRVWKVVDAGNRELQIFYRAKPSVTSDYGATSDVYASLRHAWYRSAQLVGGSAGEIDHIVDHANRTYQFTYDDDGYLTDFSEANGARKTRLKYEPWRDGLDQFGQDRQLTEVVPIDGETELKGTTIRYVESGDRRATTPAPGTLMRPREVCGITPRNDSQSPRPREDLPAGQDCRLPTNDRETTYSYTHDSSGQTTSFSVKKVLDRAAGNNPPRTATTVSDLDTIGRPTRVTDPIGTRTDLTWDNDLNAITGIESGIGPDGSEDEAAKSELQYDKVNGTGVIKKSIEYPDWPSTANARETNLAYQFSNGTMHSTAVDEAGGTFVADLTETRNPRSDTGSSYRISQNAVGDYTGNVAERWRLPNRQGASAQTFYGAGGVITSELDETNHLTHYNNPDLGGEPQEVEDPTGAKSHYKYDDVENVIGVADPRAAQPPTFDPDAAYTTTLTYDALDRLRVEKLPKLSAGSNPDEKFTTRSRTFDRDGNVLTSTDGTGTTTTINYGPMGEPRRVEVPGDAGAEVTKYAYDDATRLIARVDPLGSSANLDVSDQMSTCTGAAAPGRVAHMTRFCLDAAGQRVAEVRTSADASDPAALITSYAFDRRGNVVGMNDARRNGGGSVSAAVTAAAPASLPRMTYSYDKSDELTDQRERPASPDTQTLLHTHYDYDPNGNRTRALPPRAYPNGDDNADTSYATKWFYDLKDQREAVRTPSGCTAYAYQTDGKLQSVTSPRGTVAAGGTPPDDCAEGGPFTYFTTTYHYDGQGNVLSRSIPYAPDQYGRSDDEFSSWAYTYIRDEVGNPSIVIDPRGDAFVNHFYDSGELQKTDSPGSYRLDWGGGENGNPDPGEHFGEADSGADLQVSQGGPSISESPNLSRNTASGGAPDLPDSGVAGKFGTVDRREPGDMLPDAGTTDFSYDNEMRLTDIKDAAGNSRKITYDPQGRVESKQWPFKPAEPEQPGQPAKPAQPTVHTYGYDLDGNLSSYKDTLQNETTFEYDGYDRRASELTPGGYSVPDPGAVVDGQLTKFRYDRNGNLLDRITAEQERTFHFGYDTLDRLSTERDPSGAQWSYGYDLNGNRTCAEAPKGGDDICDPASDFSSTFEYYKSDQLKQMVDPARNETDYDYDEDGNRTGVVAPGSAPDSGGTEVRRKSTTEYDGRGLPWRVTTSTADDQDKSITLQEYDENGNARRIVNPSGVSSTGLPKVAFPTYTNASDHPEAAWHATVREYDTDNQLTAIRFPWSKEASSTEDPVDDPQSPADAEAHGDDHKLVERFRRTGDPLRRVTSVVAPHEADDDLAPRTSYKYFDNGWPETQSQQRDRDPSSTESVHDVLVSFDYDPEGNQTQWHTKHAGSTAQGREIDRRFNEDGTLFERVAIKHHADDDGDTRRTYRYTYDANRSLTGIFDYGDQDRAPGEDPPDVGDHPHETAIKRDAAEREHAVNEKWAAGRDTMFTYDDDGNVKDRWSDGVYASSNGVDTFSGSDAKRTHFTFNALDQEESNWVDPKVDENDPHDADDRRTTDTKWWPSGDMKKRTKPNGTVELRYFDPRGRITEKTRDPVHADAPTDTQDYEYDVDGNRTKDERGTEAFDPRGQLVKWTRGDKYDKQGVGGDQTLNSKVGSTVTYTRNDNGDVQKKVDDYSPAPGYGATTTTYDYAGERLRQTEVTRPEPARTFHESASFSYDDFGSVTKIETKTLGADEQPPDPPDGIESPTPCSDVPNAAKPTVTRYCFDEFERMVLARGQGIEKPTAYTYDGLDRRNYSLRDTPHQGEPGHKDDKTMRVDYSYVGTSQLLSREDDTGGEPDAKHEIKTYDYDSQGHRLGQQRREPDSTTDPKFRPYATDANGSVEGLEASDGEIGDDNYLYDPYGESEKAPSSENDVEDPGLSADAKENPFRFEGFYFDSGVKSYDMQAREYRPDVGRFLSHDSYESAVADQVLQADPLTQNRYAFAGGNPVNNVEFDGHWTPADASGGHRHAAGGSAFAHHYNSQHHPHSSGGGSAAPSDGGSADGSPRGTATPSLPAAKAHAADVTALTAFAYVTSFRGPCGAAKNYCSEDALETQVEEASTRILEGQDLSTMSAFDQPNFNGVEPTDDLQNAFLIASGGWGAAKLGLGLFRAVTTRTAVTAARLAVTAGVQEGGLTVTQRFLLRVTARRSAYGPVVPVSSERLDGGALNLARRIGGQPQVRFANAPKYKTFDAVSKDYIGEAKPGGFKLGSKWRSQARDVFETSLATNRRPYFHFDGAPERDVIRKLVDYGDQYGVEPVIDTVPFGG